jgi:putative ABC transport system permease protein
LVFYDNDELKNSFFVKIAPAKVSNAMLAIEGVWKNFISDAPFSYQFMDAAFDNLYKDDLKVSKLILVFSSLSIIISVLGLFGLSAFIAEQRRKEIGIRKVFGASVKGITVLLTAGYVKLVALSIVIAFPAAWWSAGKWLDNFVYKIQLSWWIFFLAGAIVLSIAFVTVFLQTIRAATANPVKSLRSE